MSSAKPHPCRVSSAWLRGATTVIKRDMEIDRDEVRVMTVHGAKGLEAPMVILADTTTPPRGAHPPRLLEVRPPTLRPARPPAWSGSGPAGGRRAGRRGRPEGGAAGE